MAASRDLDGRRACRSFFPSFHLARLPPPPILAVSLPTCPHSFFAPPPSDSVSRRSPTCSSERMTVSGLQVSPAERFRHSHELTLVHCTGMGESTVAPTRVINPKHTAIVAEPTILTIDSPTIVTFTPSVVVVTVTSLVEETAPTAAPSLAATFSTDENLFGGASSSAIKIINISDDATSSSALETETSFLSTTDVSAPSPTASAALSSESISEAASSTGLPLDSASSTEASATETERVFGLPSQSQIAVVSSSAESIESP